MKQYYFAVRVCYVLLIALAAVASPFRAAGQFNFSPSGLAGAELANPTSLQFGPDGRLYVSQQNGIIKVMTIVRHAANNYSVTATEIIDLINQIPNHNDDGSLAPQVTTRQVTGILVKGTPTRPVLYVSSSDSRIGGPEGDLNLDTNSGIVSMLVWNGTVWVKTDLVRGLPRSEENHSVNGMQIDEATNTLYLSVGGHTNAGSPSINFAYANEFALSAAILSIDLNAIEAMPTQGAGNTAFKYDLPTVDDPTRANTGGKDVNDPFGGNDGLNQAKIVPGGPVQIFSPGYRNAYDLVITKTPGKAGRVYVIDNGANQGWGGYPANEGPAGDVTNNYVPGEPGSTGPGVNEAQVNNLDNLHYIGNLATYRPGSFYGGHPNPIRANPSGAGLYTHNGTSGVWRTSTTGANPLPADWPPVPVANPVEGDFHMPGSAADGSLLTFNNSTNGMAEYTASNFNNALKGCLLACGYEGSIWKITFNDAGTDVTNARASSNKLNQEPAFASGFGSIPLDITTQGDNDIFPGTVWAATYGSQAITIFEPQDMVNCSGLRNDLDDDADGYTNADEMDNNTSPCSASSRPPDNDGDKISDLNDPDDDNDGIPDSSDYFPIDAHNGLATFLPLDYPMLNNSPGTGFFGLGFTGLMSNKRPDNDYLNNFKADSLIAGGAVGLFSVLAVPAGDALGTLNNQQYAFQFGVNVNTSSGPFTVNTRLTGPFFNNQLPAGNQSQGVYIGTGDQSNYLKIVLNANGGTPGIQVVLEKDDVPVIQQYAITGGITGVATLDLYISVNPLTGSVQAKYARNGGTPVNLGAPLQVSGELLHVLQGSAALAVGIIATSRGAAPFTANWDYIKITADAVPSGWTTVAPSHTPKWVGFSIAYNNKMYVFSGFDQPQLHTTPKVEVYDPVADAWTYLADMPVPVTHAGITQDSNKVYVSGGFIGGLPGDPNSDLLQVYDISTNTWSTGPKLPARSGGNALVREGRKLHSFGGLQDDRQTGATAHYVLDLDSISVGWKTAAPLPVSRCHFASACVAGKIYALGGQTGHDGPYQDVALVQVYDPSTDTWTRLKDMPYVRSHSEPATFVLDGRVYLVGGRSGNDTNILGKVTVYDPATDSWTEDTPLPAGIRLFGPAAEAIGSELIVSNGGLNTCCDPQTTTRKRGIARMPQLKTGFLPAALTFHAAAGDRMEKEVLLWTLSGSPSYTIDTGALPAWLTVTPASGSIDLLGGTEVKITVNTAGLAAGQYAAAVKANAPGYVNTTLNVTLTVTASAAKVLYLYGSVPPGEVQMKLSDTGSTGMSQFSQALKQAGFAPSEAQDTSVVLNAALLNPYKVLILGSNNRRFTAAEQAAVAAWVNAGGGLVAWSDAAFGWQHGGVNSTDGLLSDNDLVQQFGMQFLRDNGAPVGTLDQWNADHYINRYNRNGGVRIRAEGVSPVRTSQPAFILAPLPACCAQLNPLDGAVTPNDAALAVAQIGRGRVAGYFDRNTFWNAGSGTRLSEADNKVFAQRLITWVSGMDTIAVSDTAVYRINAGGPAYTAANGIFAADNYFSPSPGFTYNVSNPIAGTTDDALYQTERASSTDNGTFSYHFPVTKGAYRVVLYFADIYWTAPGNRLFDVSIENKKVLDNYDIVGKVGAFTATTEEFTTQVADDTLDILFSALASDGGIDRPKVSAIEIFKLGSTNQPPIANAGRDTVLTLPASSVTLTGSGTDADGTITGYSWSKVSGSGNIQSPAAATTLITGLTQGVSVFQLIVTDNQGAASIADQVVVTVNPSAAPGMVYRINAGGPQVNSSKGIFDADSHFAPSPGYTYAVTNPIAGTTDDSLYQTERSADTDNGSFSYALPLSNGTYKVTLHFAELYWTAVGKRIFDVSLEGNKVLDNFDIVKKAGVFTATTETFNAIVSDGMLNIDFTAAKAEGGVDRPKVAAIEVFGYGTGNQPPMANAGPDKVITLPTNTVTLVGTGTDSDGTITAYAWKKVSGSGNIVSPSSATTQIAGLTEGVSEFSLVVTDNQGDTSVADRVYVTVNPAAPTIVYRINAGGPADSNAIGVFVADKYFQPAPGLTTKSSKPVGGTSADALFQTQRTSTAAGGSFSYALPVSRGNYTVRLYFAELELNAAGSRVFDIFLEGTRVKDNFDIFKKISANNATTETFVRDITDGTLNIMFSASATDGGVYKPTVSAIEVFKNTNLPGSLYPGLYIPPLYDNLDSLYDVIAGGKLRLYPNPSADGVYTLALPPSMNGKLQYELLSPAGMRLVSGSLPASSDPGRRTFLLDFSRQTMVHGIYMLRLTGDGARKTIKLMRN